LQMQLKTANISNKGGDKAKMLLQKELEKAQKKHADLDAKYRSVSAEKLQACLLYQLTLRLRCWCRREQLSGSASVLLALTREV
jgi:hypothetical protein